MFYIRLNTKKKCASPNKYKGFSTFIPTTGIFMMIHDVKTETKRNKILISDIFNIMKKEQHPTDGARNLQTCIFFTLDAKTDASLLHDNFISVFIAL